MCIYIYILHTVYTWNLPLLAAATGNNDSSKSSSNSVKGWWAGPPVVASRSWKLSTKKTWEKPQGMRSQKKKQNAQETAIIY